MSSALFISYRRADSSLFADRIREHLVRAFGEKSVFRDVTDMPPGADFRQHILNTVPAAGVVLALVGPRWVSVLRERSEAEDLLRLELETALAHRRPILPLLLGDAAPPDAHELPASLAPLAGLHALRVRPDPDFGSDMGRVVAAIGALGVRRRSKWGARAAGLVITLAASAVVLGAGWTLGSGPLRARAKLMEDGTGWFGLVGCERPSFFFEDGREFVRRAADGSESRGRIVGAENGVIVTEVITPVERRGEILELRPHGDRLDIRSTDTRATTTLIRCAGP